VTILKIVAFKQRIRKKYVEGSLFRSKTSAYGPISQAFFVSMFLYSIPGIPLFVYQLFVSDDSVS
jgi:hypothetical protein